MLMRWGKNIENVISTLNKITHSISLVIVFLMMLLTTGDVVGRYFIKPIKGTFELTELGLALMVFFSLGMAQIKKDHTAIEFIVDRFPMRVQAVMSSITYLISAGLILVAAWQLFEYAKILQMGKNVSSDLSIPIYIFLWLGTVGLVFFALTFLVDFVKSVYRMVAKDEP